MVMGGEEIKTAEEQSSCSYNTASNHSKQSPQGKKQVDGESANRKQVSLSLRQAQVGSPLDFLDTELGIGYLMTLLDM